MFERYLLIIKMAESEEVKNNIVYKLIVLDIMKDKYDWKEV